MATPIDRGTAKALADSRHDAFLKAVSALLGPGRSEVSPGTGHATAAGSTGFELQCEHSEFGLLVRPEFSIGLRAEDLGGQSVLRLLVVQSLLMREMNWWLSARETGQLFMAPIQWHDAPVSVAACVELAGVLAPSIVGFIATGKPVQLR
jgi:hypothetical protein